MMQDNYACFKKKVLPAFVLQSKSLSHITGPQGTQIVRVKGFFKDNEELSRIYKQFHLSEAIYAGLALGVNYFIKQKLRKWLKSHGKVPAVYQMLGRPINYKLERKEGACLWMSAVR